MQILQCQNLCKDYTIGENIVHAIRDISIGFAQGEICAVRGPSGSGKSTYCMPYRVPLQECFLSNEDLYAYNDNQLSIRAAALRFCFSGLQPGAGTDAYVKYSPCLCC